MKSVKLKSMFFAFLAALLYAINMPFSKLLLEEIEPVFMASFLYLGAGIGIYILYYFLKNKQKSPRKNLSKKDMPFTVGMILLDILAPILLMIGLQTTNSANASLLNNFEIVATTIIALVIFKEIVSIRLWGAILLIVISSVLLTVDDFSSLNFSYGCIFIILACVCWGFENNCTRMLASNNVYEIVILKGIFSGIGSFIVALVIGEEFPAFRYILLSLVLGFVAFGLSIFFYIKAQDVLGASKTSAYYATSPFIGTLIAFLIFGTQISLIYVLSYVIMILGTILVVIDTFITKHIHVHTHQVYLRDGLVQTYTHAHSHNHYLNNEDGTAIECEHKHFHIGDFDGKDTHTSQKNHRK